jgi:hypothetical protein
VVQRAGVAHQTLERKSGCILAPVQGCLLGDLPQCVWPSCRPRTGDRAHSRQGLSQYVCRCGLPGRCSRFCSPAGAGVQVQNRKFLESAHLNFHLKHQAMTLLSALKHGLVSVMEPCCPCRPTPLPWCRLRVFPRRAASLQPHAPGAFPSAALPTQLFRCQPGHCCHSKPPFATLVNFVAASPSTGVAGTGYCLSRVVPPNAWYDICPMIHCRASGR